MNPPANTSIFARPELRPFVLGLAVLMDILILLQAFLGGRGFFVSMNLLKMHKYLGIFTLAAALVQLVVLFMALGTGGRERGRPLGMAAVLVVLVVIQLFLGFSSKDNTNSAAWHIFNGVLITGLIATYSATIFNLKSSAS